MSNIQKPKKKISTQWISIVTTLFLLLLFSSTFAETKKNLNKINPKSFSVKFSDTPIEQAFGMLAKLGHVDILLGKEVSGNISANLERTNIDRAIRAVALISGFSAQRRGNTYTILAHEEYGKDTLIDGTQIQTFKVQYIDPVIAESLITKYLSRHGTITLIPERSLLVIQDDPEFISKAEKILAQVDVKPKQILIEAKILEIALQEDETLGIDWSSKGSKTTFGTTGFSNIGSSGFFLNYLSDDLDASLKALTEEGRIKTLSTPKLMVLEDEEAEVIIGDRIGFKVTTTINSVTTESIEFIESGVILKVKAAIDNDKQIMLEIHPEVSSGSITEGIPSISTTEVTTQMIAESGESIFIGGLMKNKTTNKTSGVPGLSKIPFLGRAFSKTEDISINTETIVIIKPHLVEDFQHGTHAASIRRFKGITDESSQIEKAEEPQSLTKPIAMQNRRVKVNNVRNLWLDNSIDEQVSNR